MVALRIALIAPPWFTVPPVGYGGTEAVVAYLADGLVASGHEVTLFAPGGSGTMASLRAIYREPQFAHIGDPIIESVHVMAAYRHADEFDIIHDHTMLGLLLGSQLSIPVVHTIHGAVEPHVADYYRELSRSSNMHFVAVSQHQRTTLPESVEATVIHNALDPEAIPFHDTPDDYLLFVGRVAPQKGLVEAIEIARRANRPLRMLLKMNEQPERDYFQSVVEPAMEGVDVEVLEQPPLDVKVASYQRALATLFPISWSEPFGLVMVESMSAGTPVIAFNRASVPEVIADGETGIICNSIDEAVDAVQSIHSIDRRRCRHLVESRFVAATAVEKHVQLYQRLLADGRRDSDSPSTPIAVMPAAVQERVIQLSAASRPSGGLLTTAGDAARPPE